MDWLEIRKNKEYNSFQMNLKKNHLFPRKDTLDNIMFFKGKDGRTYFNKDNAYGLAFFNRIIKAISHGALQFQNHF